MLEIESVPPAPFATDARKRQRVFTNSAQQGILNMDISIGMLARSIQDGAHAMHDGGSASREAIADQMT